MHIPRNIIDLDMTMSQIKYPIARLKSYSEGVEEEMMVR
jgi:hypothetical protein